MKKRIFIAINLPENVRHNLTKELDILKNHDDNRVVKWVTPDLLHITLVFLGDIEESRIGAVTGVLSTIIPKHQSFACETDGLDAFPSSQNPRIIFAKVFDIAGLINKIQNEVASAL
jgi:2'-5' RNA ligase